MPLASISTTDLLLLPFAFPLGSLLIAIVIAGCIFAFAPQHPRRRRSTEADRTTDDAVRTRHAPENLALALGALAVILVFAAQNILSGYVLPLVDIVAWWQYATPVAAAALALLVTLVVIRVRGTIPSQIPVLPVVRRTWLSFGPRIGLPVAALTMLLLISTTVAAGLASSTDDQGRSALLIVPVPNEAEVDPLRPLFSGWAYGAPVLVCTLTLVIAAWALLHANAVRPYLRPESVASERSARSRVARDAVRVVIAGALLALGGAWRLIADAGATTQLTIMGVNDGAPYEVIWRYAGLASVAGWLAPLLEIAGFALLLLVASSGAKRPGAASPDTAHAATLIGAGR